ncbi:ABC transporter ATP-binding protein [Salinibacterium sp.]|uniref:ABC transporter ATP-binding protein n=1 Tax=Salinibacterium sp. TaxID=1915057 RepID=UPI00286BD267|nr:ABC transporter ATP-binding protein [Salinibacterium sp.]
MTQLSLTDVVVGFDSEPVLRGITLDVPSGALAAVVGPSGCGKTTLLRTIAGLMRARSGEIRIGQRMVATHGIHLAPEKRRVGWVPQDAALFPHLTVAENVAFGLGIGPRAARRAARGPEVARLLGLVSLSALSDRLPSQLSGGQAQRVALARALAVRPEVVLLDEPFAALDPVLRVELRTEVRALLASEGVTGILVTHDQAEALSTADFVAVMNAGTLLQFGTPREIYEWPHDPWVAGFVGESNLVAGIWRDGFVECRLGRVIASWGSASIPTPVEGQAVTLLLRPEQLTLGPEGTQPEGLPATVTTMSYGGHDVLVGLALADGTRMTSRVVSAGTLTAGAQVTAYIVGSAMAFSPQ